ncbi:hypothetical protein BDR07DRAFT_1401713, partial [Suillus spraguei]
HIWLLKFCMIKGKWSMMFSLSDDSLPAFVHSYVLVIQAPSGETPLEDVRIPHSNEKPTIVPAGFITGSEYCVSSQWHLNWLMNDNTMLDCDGTLHAKLEIILM